MGSQQSELLRGNSGNWRNRVIRQRKVVGSIPIRSVHRLENLPVEFQLLTAVADVFPPHPVQTNIKFRTKEQYVFQLDGS